MPWKLGFVLDRYKTQEMCEEAVKWVPWIFQYDLHEYKTQEMCKRDV